MGATGIVNQNLKLSSHEPTAIPQNSLGLGKPGGGLPDAKVSRFPVESEVMPNYKDDATQAGSIHEDRPRHTTESSGAEYPEVHSESILALLVTLKEVRCLRDGCFCEDEYSAAGVLLAQITLILTRLTHSIPSGRADFESIIRVCEMTAWK